MAERPVFVLRGVAPWYGVVNVEFHYSAGFALVQRQKNITAIHEAFLKEYPRAKILEASSKAPTALGKSLSPFFLELDGIAVENRFQASKVFKRGGPYLNLLAVPAIKAKTDGILKESGPLLYYEWDKDREPVLPEGWFFLWLYLSALHGNKKLQEEILQGGYDAFTDIAFNPRTGHACQAMGLAMFVSLSRKGKWEEAMESMDSFRKIVFKVRV